METRSPTFRLLPRNSWSLPRLSWDWSQFKPEIMNMVPCLVIGWEKGTYYSLFTPKLLPDYFQNNACLLSVYSLVIPRLLPGHFQSTPWLVPDYSLVTSSLLPCYSFYTTPRLLLNYSMITPRLLPDNSQTTPWLLPDYFLEVLSDYSEQNCSAWDIEYGALSWDEKKGTYYSLVTPILLPDYFQNNACLLSVYSLVIFRLLPGHFQTTP